MKRICLNDGNYIPAIGFGVFQIPNGGPTYDAVRKALAAGYRHIDTAAMYGNEEDVGRAVRDSGISRSEIFVTSKLWIQDYGYEKAKCGIASSLEKLGFDYIDLYLLHHPYGDVRGAWRALEEAKKEGKLKSIGVSNMTVKIWERYVPQFASLPAVNQVECHPFYQQKKLRLLMDSLDVRLEAFYPLGHGNKELLANPLIATLAAKYQKNSGQIIIRFLYQEGLVVLPKSVTPARIKGNIQITDFELTTGEMKMLRDLDTGKGMHDPDAEGVEERLRNKFKIHA